MPAEVLMVILGHKDVSVTLNTYFDAFAEYRNVYEEKTYNYYELQGLTFDIIDKDFIILQELNSMLDKVNISHLEDVDKEQLILVVQNIIKRYEKKDEEQEETEQSINSNIISFLLWVDKYYNAYEIKIRKIIMQFQCNCEIFSDKVIHIEKCSKNWYIAESSYFIVKKETTYF